MITFTISGVPATKLRARHRVFKSAAGEFKGVGTYTPAKTREAEQSFLAQAVAHKPETPLAGPLALELLFVLPIPKAEKQLAKRAIRFEQCLWSGEAAEPRELAHVKKPDLDNLEKLVKDAMNGVFWLDDKQVCQVTKRKIYGTHPRTEVRIQELS
jgi:Holliday junction resolvase RusA-like endonuclease